MFLALALRSPIVGTAIGGVIAAGLAIAFLAMLWRMCMRSLDATNGIEPEGPGDEGPGVRGRGPVKNHSTARHHE